MIFVDIKVVGFANAAQNCGTVQNVRVTVKDAGSNVVFDDAGTVGTNASSTYVQARLDDGEYTFSAQAYDEHGSALGPTVTAGPIVIQDRSTLPSFVPTDIQVSY